MGNCGISVRRSRPWRSHNNLHDRVHLKSSARSQFNSEQARSLRLHPPALSPRRRPSAHPKVTHLHQLIHHGAAASAPARPAARDISTSREHDNSQLFAPTIARASTYINTHPKRRPPITPTCLSTRGHAFGKGLHHNLQAEGLIYAQIVSSPQLQLIKSIASILMHQFHPQYQQDMW